MPMIRVLAATLAALVPATAWAVGGPAPGAVNAQTVKLPSGPGSVRGLADNAQVSGFTGQVQYGVPIELPAGPGGLTPALSLGYDGGLGNGPLGVGWQLSQAEIRRASVSGVSTDEELIMVMQHQRAYAAAARVITLVDEMIETVIGLAR